MFSSSHIKINEQNIFFTISVLLEEEPPDIEMDPATALELKIIMSRMRDILRGANVKAAHQEKPMYPPNVRLVCITHVDDDTTNETNDNADDKENHSSRSKDWDTSNILPLPAQCLIEHGDEGQRKEENQERQQNDDSNNNAALDVPDVKLRRRCTPEELRIIRYRNQFFSYKKSVSEMQETCEEVLSAVFHEVANELEPSILVDKMYHLELQG